MNTEVAKKYILTNHFDGMADVKAVVGGNEEIMAMKLAVEALEKQIPKKVIFGYDEQDYVRCPQCKSEIAPMDDDCLLYHCPGCGEKDAILQGDKYCFNCGQALDWSEANKCENCDLEGMRI